MFEPLVTRVQRVADDRAAEAARLLAEALADELPDDIAIEAELYEVRLRGRRVRRAAREAIDWAIAGARR
jgi:hypothetical protein